MQKPNSIIRKIAVGIDYKNSMTYIRGQKVLNNEYEISLIEQDKGNENINVYITNEKNESLIWKEFSKTMPISIEFYIDYEKS